MHYSNAFGIIEVFVAMVTMEYTSCYRILMNLCNKLCILIAISKATKLFEVSDKCVDTLTKNMIYFIQEYYFSTNFIDFHTGAMEIFTFKNRLWKNA